MRVFFNFMIIQVVLNLYIFYRGWKVLPKKSVVRLPFAAVFVIELTIYFLGFIFSHDIPVESLHYVVWIGTSWSVFAIYTSTLLLAYDTFRYIEKWKKILPRSVDLERKRNKYIYYLAAISIVLAAMLWGSYRFNNPVITEKTIEIAKSSPIDEIRIAVVADIHAGFLINKPILSMYVDRIMEQKPDMILIAGDIIDYDLKSVMEQNMQEEFSRLQAPYGVYASTGNHEYIDVDDTRFAKIDWLRDKSGLTLLQDTAILVDDAFYVVGREDDKLETRKSLAEIVKGVNKNLPLIVMNHEPHNLQEEVDSDTDIAVYGHTHDGQLFPANILVKFMYELSAGYKKKEDTHIYVTSGLGLAGPQYRIGTKSEIVILNVKFNK